MHLLHNSGCSLLDPTDEHLCQHLTHLVLFEGLTLILKLFPLLRFASEEINKKWSSSPSFLRTLMSSAVALISTIESSDP